MNPTLTLFVCEDCVWVEGLPEHECDDDVEYTVEGMAARGDTVAASALTLMAGHAWIDMVYPRPRRADGSLGHGEVRVYRDGAW